MIEVTRETHEPPKWLNERLAQVGGRNLYGQPNFRVVWGWSRLAWMGGKWEDRNAAGNLIRAVIEYRREPKYVPFNRWHLERWLPPEHYGSPELWQRDFTEVIDGISVQMLGPFPGCGEYEHVFTVQRPDGSFLQLLPHVCEVVVQAVLFSHHLSSADRKESLQSRETRKERAVAARSDAILRNALEPMFYGQPHIGYRGPVRTDPKALHHTMQGKETSQ